MNATTSKLLNAALVAASLLVTTSPALALGDEAAVHTPRPATQKDKPAEAKPAHDVGEHVRIGPLLGVGFPRPFSVALLAKVERLVGLGIEYGFLPRTSLMNAEASFRGIAADLRVFPFRGGFFIGARAGRQWLSVSAHTTVASAGTFSEGADATTWFVNPRVGFLYTFSSGITVGFDAGVQLPITPSYVRTGTAPNTATTSQRDYEEKLVAVADALGNKPTPTVDLLRVGFLF